MPQATVAGEAKTVECIIPILSVTNLAASMKFYGDVLGFKTDWKADSMASVSRDGRAIMLCQQGQGHAGTWVWIGWDGIDALYESCVAKGVNVRRKPTNFSWAYELQIEDPDGHVLRLGEDPRSDQPSA